MANEAYVSLIGFVATQPRKWATKNGALGVSMRVGWTPRIIDRTTGEWSDQPTSFVTVQCFRKVAEHASVCLRRGEPVVVRGTIRVREYTDQSGQRRSSVEVQADSIGHDIARGISTYSKLPVRADMTAEEYEQSLAAADRGSGDGDQAAADGPGESDRDASGDPARTGEAETGNGGAADGEFAVSDEYDEPEAGDEPVRADDPLSSVGSGA